MLLFFSVLYSCVFLAAAGRSPHADYVEELVKNNAFGPRISDNVFEDAVLDVPDLIRKYNYPLEEHSVTTSDGYILGMHRIPHGRDAHNTPGDRPIVFLMHGLLCSSADFVLMGPGTAMAYDLAEAGFDVWMGNARGNFYSRRHVRLNPDSLLNTDFWDFSWDEIGNYDLPAMIDYVLTHTEKSRLHYVGHSQGTTSFFVMGSLQPEYNNKIISMHAMAPVAYMAHNKNLLLLALSPFANNIEAVASLIGIGELLPNSLLLNWAGEALCRDGAVFQIMCSNIIFLIGGWNENQLNKTMLPVVFGHSPAGSSVGQFVHYAQSITGKEFRRYDHGPVRNLMKYGRLTPPRYDLPKVTAPVFLHYSEGDPWAEVPDVERLLSELGNPIGKFRIQQRTFSHLDFLWGINANTLVYDRVINLMRARCWRLKSYSLIYFILLQIK